MCEQYNVYATAHQFQVSDKVELETLAIGVNINPAPRKMVKEFFFNRSVVTFYCDFYCN